MDFPAGKRLAWPLKKAILPGALMIRYGVEIVVFSMFVLSDAQT